MNQNEIMTKIETIVDESKVGLLATTDKKNCPRVRWMTPAILPQRGGSIYAFSDANAMKIQDIMHQGEVKWLFQTHDLKEVVSARGITHVTTNPSIKNEVMDLLVSHLTKLWTLNLSHTETVVLETVITEATYTRPLDNYEITVVFK